MEKRVRLSGIKYWQVLTLAPCLAFLSACGSAQSSTESDASSEGSSLSACSANSVTTAPCKVESSGFVVSNSFGDDVTSWSNATASTTVRAEIPNGFYANQDVMLAEPNLLPANIVSGVSIFGVTGSASGFPSACSSPGLQASNCSASNGTYWTNVLGANVAGADGSAAVTVPAGYYNGSTTVTAQDSDLTASNIKSGVTVLGVSGNLTPAYSACSDDALNASQCSTAASRYVTATAGSDVTSWANGSATTTVSATLPNAYYNNKVCSFVDADLLAANIKNGVNIFGVAGTYIGTFALNMASSAHRDPGAVPSPVNGDNQSTSLQITLANETGIYAGASLPTTSGYTYRDIPDVTKDDEGYLGTACKYAPRPSSNCGTTQLTIAGRIADCESVNPSTSTWNGSSACNGGQGTWKLVTRSASLKEVWQDQRTGLLWSSIAATNVNWCQATGNTQLSPASFYRAFNNTSSTAITGNGTISSLQSGSSAATETVTITFSNATTFTVSGSNCGGGSISAGGLSTSAGSTVTWSRAGYCAFTLTQGSVNFAANDKIEFKIVGASAASCAPGSLQAASPVSWCAEDASVNAPAGENWGSASYLTAKGGLGKNTTPSVRWRVPTVNDYRVADANGIRYVMPDMGIAGTARPTRDTSTAGGGEWTSTMLSSDRRSAWRVETDAGASGGWYRDFGNNVRCVGRGL